MADGLASQKAQSRHSEANGNRMVAFAPGRIILVESKDARLNLASREAVAISGSRRLHTEHREARF